jgi:hypothetical protein
MIKPGMAGKNKSIVVIKAGDKHGNIQASEISGALRGCIPQESGGIYT